MWGKGEEDVQLLWPSRRQFIHCKRPGTWHGRGILGRAIPVHFFTACKMRQIVER